MRRHLAAKMSKWRGCKRFEKDNGAVWQAAGTTHSCRRLRA